MNNVALGASFALLGNKIDTLLAVIADTFSGKDPAISELNKNAAKAGFDYVKTHFKEPFFYSLQKVESEKKILLTGNETIGIGAIKAGCKFFALYPMTPINGLLYFASSHAKKYGFVYKQPEDEISGINMAIGASFAELDKTIIVITGDGGFQLNIQELQTIYHHKLNIKIILLNNCCYGMVRQFQEQYFNSRFQSTVIGYSCPNFQDVVSAYKISSNKIIENNDIDKKLKELFKNKKPGFLEVNIIQDYKALPKLSVGKPVEDQEPFLSRDELKSNMLINMVD
jgi:TPP-dependent indolepyruvate ferredoxin oxidoreductase alpha subunit